MLKFTFSTSVISYWTRLQTRSPPWFEALWVHHVEGCQVPTRKAVFICDLTLFQGLSCPAMSFPITPLNAGSFLNCKGNIQWFSSSAAEASAPRTAGSMKGLFNFITSLRSAIAG